MKNCNKSFDEQSRALCVCVCVSLIHCNSFRKSFIPIQTFLYLERINTSHIHSVNINSSLPVGRANIIERNNNNTHCTPRYYNIYVCIYQPFVVPLRPITFSHFIGNKNCVLMTESIVNSSVNLWRHRSTRITNLRKSKIIFQCITSSVWIG